MKTRRGEPVLIIPILKAHLTITNMKKGVMESKLLPLPERPVQIRKNVNSSPDDKIDDNEVAIMVDTAYLYGSDTKNQSPGDVLRKKRLLKSQISLTEERRKRNITLLVEEVMGELEFVAEEDAP
ncbi:hypothetical protein POM88_041209 [Heracleum sosnowskyi]|uniref:Uncharacterized protein n=1 Tax=Heracleum sosnowskyi TaxID=360622 RepID=A0AAD8HFG8_9APIA|nr:hypothetical protein POM88_041209 [Heracleum sosnowskyi]